MISSKNFQKVLINFERIDLIQRIIYTGFFWHLGAAILAFPYLKQRLLLFSKKENKNLQLIPKNLLNNMISKKATHQLLELTA